MHAKNDQATPEVRTSPDTPNPVSVLVVEDERDLREVLQKWLSASGYAAWSAADGLEAVKLAHQQPFDVIITDLKLPGLNGLQLLNLFQDLQPSAIVIFLSGQGTIEDAIAALREGRAYDFIQKPLREMRQLNLIIEKALLNRQIRNGANLPREPRSPAAQFEPLTERELKLARLLTQGLEVKAIGEQLHVSEKTVRNNLTQFYEKLGVKNRVQAVLFCIQNRLI